MKTIRGLCQQLIVSILFACFLLPGCNNPSPAVEPAKEANKHADTNSTTTSCQGDELVALFDCNLHLSDEPVLDKGILSLSQASAQPAVQKYPYPASPLPTKESELPIPYHTSSVSRILNFSDEKEGEAASSHASALVSSSTEVHCFDRDWEHFEVNYDDSSDEEVTTKQVVAYNLVDSIQKFKQQLSDSNPTIKKAQELKKVHFQNKHMLSFLTHAIGLQVLYGEAVTAKYYPLKSKHLKQGVTKDLQEVTLKYISEVVQNIIYKLFLHEKNETVGSLYHAIIDILVADFQEKHQASVTSLEQLVLQKSRSILLLKKGKQFPTDLQDEFKKLANKVATYITSLREHNDAAMQQLFSAKNYTLPHPKSLPSTFAELQQYSILKSGLQENTGNTKEEIDSVLKNDKNKMYCLTDNGNGEKICTDRYTKSWLSNAIQGNNHSAFEKKVLEKVYKVEPRKSPKKDTFIRNYDTSELLELSFLLFQVSINQEEQQPHSIIQNRKIKPNATLQTSKLAPYKDMLHEFIPITYQRIGELINHPASDKDLNEIIEHCMQPLQNFLLQQERATLPNSYHFDFESGYSTSSFLANIRLCNRSATRFINNQKLLQNDILSKHKQSRGCQFPASKDYALETQEVTNKGNRTDLVINNGTYKDVYERFTRIKSIVGKGFCGNRPLHILNTNISDQDLAYWIQQTLQGKELKQLNHTGQEHPITLSTAQLQEIKKAIIDVTYLLFGTEASRNPASLIHHHMMLDLITTGKYGWEALLIGKEGQSPMLPMELEGAVQSARALHIAYNPLMPYPYMYPKDAEAIGHTKTIELISREGELTSHWLKYCAKIEIDLSKDIVEEDQRTITNAIHRACKKWLGFEVQQAGTQAGVETLDKEGTTGVVDIWSPQTPKEEEKEAAIASQ